MKQICISFVCALIALSARANSFFNVGDRVARLSFQSSGTHSTYQMGTIVEKSTDGRFLVELLLPGNDKSEVYVSLDPKEPTIRPWLKKVNDCVTTTALNNNRTVCKDDEVLALTTELPVLNQNTLGKSAYFVGRYTSADLSREAYEVKITNSGESFRNIITDDIFIQQKDCLSPHKCKGSWALGDVSRHQVRYQASVEKINLIFQNIKKPDSIVVQGTNFGYFSSGLALLINPYVAIEGEPCLSINEVTVCKDDEVAIYLARTSNWHKVKILDGLRKTDNYLEKALVIESEENIDRFGKRIAVKEIDIIDLMELR